MPPSTKTGPTKISPTDFAGFTDDALADALQGDAVEGETVTPPRPLDYTPNVALLQTSQGDPLVWAREMAALVQHITSAHIDEQTFRDWLVTYSSQVSQVTYRHAYFQVLNHPLVPHAEGDAALHMLQLRDEIAQGFRGMAKA